MESPQPAELLRTSLVQVKVGNKIYDAVYEPRCSVCIHPARMRIEERILQNYSYRAAAAEFSNVEFVDNNGIRQVFPEVNYDAVRHHFKCGHMPLSLAAVRELSERRAREMGVELESAVERYVDYYTFAEAVVARGFDRLVTGEVEPDLRDTIAAAKLLKDIESDRLGSVDSEAWNEAMMVYFEAAKQVMAPDQWDRFAELLTKNPILRAIEQKMNVVDAEVVE